MRRKNTESEIVFSRGVEWLRILDHWSVSHDRRRKRFYILNQRRSPGVDGPRAADAREGPGLLGILALGAGLSLEREVVERGYAPELLLAVHFAEAHAAVVLVHVGAKLDHGIQVRRPGPVARARCIHRRPALAHAMALGAVRDAGWVLEDQGVHGAERLYFL